MSDADSFSDREMQLSPRESDPEYLWDAIEILKQKKDQYLIKWSGLDPKTGKPWPDSWTNKSDCTYDLIQTWEEKRAQKKKEEMLQRKGVFLCIGGLSKFTTHKPKKMPRRVIPPSLRAPRRQHLAG